MIFKKRGKESKMTSKVMDPGKKMMTQRSEEPESNVESESSSVKLPFTDTSSEWSFCSNDFSYDSLVEMDNESDESESEIYKEGRSKGKKKATKRKVVENIQDVTVEEMSQNAATLNPSQEPRTSGTSRNILNEHKILNGNLNSPNACDIVENSCDSLSSDPYLSETLSNKVSAVRESKVALAQRGESSNKWDKKHACKFCKKKVTKMSTHLQRVHKEEDEVIRVLRMKKGTKERRTAWGKLLNEGDYEHNFDVLKEGSGTLIPKYRNKKRRVEDYVTCPYCKGLYFRSLLAFHVASCLENPGIVQKRGQSVKEGALLMPVPQKFSEGFYRNVLENMKQDDILCLIKNDHLLTCFGEHLYYQKDLEEHTSGHISGRLRELGRLLKCLREKSEMKISTSIQALHVSNFDTLIACVRELTDFDESCNQFKKGTLALKIGYSLKRCASILKAEAIKNEDFDLKKQAQSFEDLISENWYGLVSATAAQSIHRARQNKPRLLPACQDIEKVHHLLNEKCQSEDYGTLAKATLCLISLFNRKRVGEVQRIKVINFERGMLCGMTNERDILQGLSELEKKLMNYFNRIEIKDKFNRIVPVLLTSQMVQSIKRLIEMRHSMVPPIDSPYLFATRTGVWPYRGSDVIREFAKEVEVSNLTMFTFTHLRKQIATLSQTMEISKWEQDRLAKFLSHDIRIHRNVYQQTREVLDKAKVAKILLNVNKGIILSSENVLMDENEELADETNACHDADDVSLSESDSEAEERVSMPSSSTSGTEKIEVSKLSDDIVTTKGPTLFTRKVAQRKAWTEEEKQAVKTQLYACIAMNRVPKKHEAERAIFNEPVLNNRTWRNVKDFVYNIIKKSTGTSQAQISCASL